MKIATLLYAICLCFAVNAQHPLVGTWEMISIKGTGAEGEKFAFDTTQVRELKIITPTHYMLIAHTVEGDSLVFNRCYAGTVQIEDDRYLEVPILSSLPIFENVKSNFKWKLDGDRFIQSGTFTRPDGKTIVLDELVFKKVKVLNSYEQNPAIGFWELVSTNYVNFDGVKGSHTNEKRLHVITPTHWMRISHRDGKFDHAMGGTYAIRNGKTYPSVSVYSVFAPLPGPVEVIDKVKDGKLYASGVIKESGGKTFTWEDVFIKR